MASLAKRSHLVRATVASKNARRQRFNAAIGRTSSLPEPQRVRVRTAGVELFRDRGPIGHHADTAIRADTVRMKMDLNAGGLQDRFLTCDETAEYVQSDAAYRT